MLMQKINYVSGFCQMTAIEILDNLRRCDLFSEDCMSNIKIDYKMLSDDDKTKVMNGVYFVRAHVKFERSMDVEEFDWMCTIIVDEVRDYSSIPECMRINKSLHSGFVPLKDVVKLVSCLMALKERDLDDTLEFDEAELNYERIVKDVRVLRNFERGHKYLALIREGLKDYVPRLDKFIRKYISEDGIEQNFIRFNTPEEVLEFEFWRGEAVYCIGERDEDQRFAVACGELCKCVSNYPIANNKLIEILWSRAYCDNISPESWYDSVVSSIKNFFSSGKVKTKNMFHEIIDSLLGLVSSWISESLWKSLSQSIYGFIDGILDPLGLLDRVYEKITGIWKKQDEEIKKLNPEAPEVDYNLKWSKLLYKLLFVIVTIILGVLTYANWDSLLACVGISNKNREAMATAEGSSFSADFCQVLGLVLTPLLGSACTSDGVNVMTLLRETTFFVNFGRTIGNAFCTCLSILPKCLSGVLIPLFGTEDQISAYYTSVMIEKSTPILEYSKVASVYSQNEYIADVEEVLTWAQPIVERYGSRTNFVEFRNRYNKLLFIMQQIHISEDMHRPRVIPFWIHIAAVPGVGKSTMVPYLLKYIKDNFSIDGRPLNGVWEKSADPNFFTGYRGEEIVVWDEFLNVVDQKAYADDLTKMLSICSNTPYFPPMASVEESSSVGVKGTPFRPVVIITLNNTLSVSNDREDIEMAILRRRNVCLVLHPNPTYKDHFNNGWKFDESFKDVITKGEHILGEFYPTNTVNILDVGMQTCPDGSVAGYSGIFDKIKEKYIEHLQVNSMFNPHQDVINYAELKKQHFKSMNPFDTSIISESNMMYDVDDVVTVVNNSKGEIIPSDVSTVKVIKKEDVLYVTFVVRDEVREVKLEDVADKLGTITNLSRKDETNCEKEDYELSDKYLLKYRYNVNQSGTVFSNNDEKLECIEYIKQYFVHHTFSAAQNKYIETTLDRVVMLPDESVEDRYNYYVDISGINGWGWKLCDAISKFFNFEKREIKILPKEEKKWLFKWNMVGCDTKTIEYPVLGLRMEWHSDKQEVCLFIPKEFKQFMRIYNEDNLIFARSYYGDRLQTFTLYERLKDNKKNSNKPTKFLPIYLSDVYKALLNAITKYSSCAGTIFYAKFKERPEQLRWLVYDITSTLLSDKQNWVGVDTLKKEPVIKSYCGVKCNYLKIVYYSHSECPLLKGVLFSNKKEDGSEEFLFPIQRGGPVKYIAGQRVSTKDENKEEVDEYSDNSDLGERECIIENVAPTDEENVPINKIDDPEVSALEAHVTNFSSPFYVNGILNLENVLKAHNVITEELFGLIRDDDWAGFFAKLGFNVKLSDLLDAGVDMRNGSRVFRRQNELYLIDMVTDLYTGEFDSEDIAHEEVLGESISYAGTCYYLNADDNTKVRRIDSDSKSCNTYPDMSFSPDFSTMCPIPKYGYVCKSGKRRMIFFTTDPTDKWFSKCMEFLSYMTFAKDGDKKIFEKKDNYKKKVVICTADSDDVLVNVDDVNLLTNEQKRIMTHFFHVKVPALTYKYYEITRWVKNYCSYVHKEFKGKITVKNVLTFLLGDPNARSILKVVGCEADISRAQAWGRIIGTSTAFISAIISVGYFIWQKNDKKRNAAPVVPESWDSKCEAFNIKRDRLFNEDEVVSTRELKRRKANGYFNSSIEPEAYQLTSVKIEIGDYETYGIALYGNNIITHYHTIHALIAAHSGTVSCRIVKIATGESYTGSLEVDDVNVLISADLIGFKFNCASWPPIRQNLSCFLTKADYFQVNITNVDRHGFIVKDSTKYGFYYSLSKAGIHYDYNIIGSKEKKNLYVKEFLLYEVDSAPGWCGNVVKTLKSGVEYIVGMHIAGKDVTCDTHNGFATLLFRERVEALLGISIHDGLTKECIGGKVQCESRTNLIEEYDAPKEWSYYVPNSSKLHLSPAGVDEIYENTVEPAILDKKDSRSKGRDPFDYGTACLMENEQATIDEGVLEKVKFQLISKIQNDNMVKMKPRVLTLDEAIGGIAGRLTPMNSKSGIGYPSKLKYSSKKKDMFDFERSEVINPEFRVAMEEYNKKWLSGEIKEIYVEAFLKDELQKISKVDDCRTRMIYCFDTMFNILTRQRFGYALIIMNNLKHEIATGLNSASKDFDLDIYRYLEEVIPEDCPKDHFVAGDYKSFDLHMQIAFKNAAFDVLYSLLETFISRDEWNRYVELANHPHVRIRDKVYVFKSANFSGNIFTTIINDLVNSLMMRYLFDLKYPNKRFDDYVRAVYCGDDHILSINRKEVDFSGTYIAEKMKLLNQIYTSDIKDAEIEDYREFEQISFLGCVPVKHLGFYVGALKKSTLESHLLWVRDDAYFDALVDAFVHFASLHGKDYYLSYTEKIFQVYRKRNRSFFFSSYDAVVYEMVNNSAYYGELIAESIVTNTTSVPDQVGVSYETSFMNDDEDNVGNDVGQIATNFLYKTNFNWKSTQASGAVIAKYNLLDLVKMGSSDPQATMFKQFLYFSSDFKIRVMTNGSPFQQGLLRVVYIPYNDVYNVRLSDIYNFRGVDINPKGSDDIILDVPFTYNTPLARTTPLGKPDTVPTDAVSNYNSIGSIYFVVVSPLAYTSGKDVSVSIYLALENPNFQVPIPLDGTAESNTTPINLSAPNPWGNGSTSKPVEGPNRSTNTGKSSYIVLQRNKKKRSARRFGNKRQEKTKVKGIGKPVTNKRHKNAYLYKIDRKNKKLKNRFLKGDIDITAYASCNNKDFFKRKAEKYKGMFQSVAQIADNCEGWKVCSVVSMIANTVREHMHLSEPFYKIFEEKIGSILIKKDPLEDFVCDEDTITYIMNVLKLMMFFDKPMDFDLYPAVTKYPTLCNNVTRVPCYDMQLLPGTVQSKGRLALATNDTNIQRLLNYEHTSVINWDTTMAVETSLMSIPCNSFLSNGIVDGDNCSVPLFVINQFKYWSSDIEFKFKFVKTSFHTGRLRLIVGYGCKDPTSAKKFRGSSFTTVIDVAPDKDEAVVVVPYLSMFDMLETVYCNKPGYGVGDTNSFGYVVLEVANTLSCSVDTVKNSIDIVVTKRFVNSRVCVPRSVPLVNTNPCEITVAAAESLVNETEDNKTDLEVVNPTVEDDRSEYNGDEALVQGNLAPEDSETNPYQVTSVYDVLRRYTIVPPSGYAYELNKAKTIGTLTFRMNFSSNFDDLFICKTGGLNVRIFCGKNTRLTINYVPTYYGREEYVYRTGMFNAGGANCSVDKKITYDGIRPYHAVEKSYYSGNESWIDVHLPFQSIVDFSVYSYYGNMVATLFSESTLPSTVEMWISAGDDYTVGTFVPPQHFYGVTQRGMTLTSNEFYGDTLFRV
nr:MAG: polyprotein [Posavirus sp.]